jgi:tetratricopeptide (TPR) repeat protein
MAASSAAAGERGAPDRGIRVTAETVAAPAATPAVPNVAWYLHSQDRHFGPLTEDEMRGYFRAGMVKQGDAIAAPGRVGWTPAVDVAALLGITSVLPVAAATAAPSTTSIRYSPPEPRPAVNPGLLAVGALVALVGIAYYFLHKPAISEASADGFALEESGSFVPAPPAAPVEPGYVEEPTQPAAVSVPTRDAVVPEQPAEQTTSTPMLLELPPPQEPQAEQPVAPMQIAVDPWWEEAKHLVDARNWNALLAHTTKWTAAEPRSERAWWYKGVAHNQLDDYNGAIEAYKQALAISPGHVQLRENLAENYMLAGRHRDAADLLQQLVKEMPNDARMWNDLGTAWANAGEFDESVAAFEKAVQINPNNRQTWENFSRAYARFGMMDRAKEAMARANGR